MLGKNCKMNMTTQMSAWKREDWRENPGEPQQVRVFKNG